MRIHRLTLRHFRGVTERTVRFADAGVTIVEGPNESGKTSLPDALDLLLDYRDDSTAQAVRSAKPVGVDAGAEVEAELSAGPYRLTYAKRFHRDRATTLVVHEPRSEQLTGREAHDRVLAILDETVDVALWRALRLQQGAELDQADLSAGTSLAAALDTVAGAGIGGDRETSVYERVRAEFERYHTPTGRPNATLKRLVDAHEEVLAETDRLSIELDALDADIELVGRLETELAELRSRVTDARRRAQDLAAARGALERRLGEVEQLRLAAELASAERARADEAVHRRAALTAEADRAAGEVSALAEKHENLDPALNESEKARTAAHDAAAELRTRLAAERQRLAAATAAMDAVRDREQQAVLRQRLARVSAAQAEMAEADAVLEAVRVDDDALQAIEDAHHDVLVARAALEAQAPTLTIEALEGLPLVTDGETRHLDAGERVEQTVTDAAQVRIGSVASVTVRAGTHAEKRARRLEAATAALAALLASAGVTSVTEARHDRQRRADAEQQRRRAGATLAEALAGESAAALTARLERLIDRVGDDPAEAGDPEALRAAADEATRAVAATEEAMAEAERVAAEATDLRDRRLAEARLLEARLTDAERRRHDAATALAAARDERPDAALRADAAEAASAHEAAQLAYGDALRRLEADDPEQTRRAAADAELVLQRLAARQRQGEDDLRDARSRLAVRGEQGLHERFGEAMRDLEHARRERERAEARAASARLLFERMSVHRDAARRAYAAPFREKLERLGRIVFGDRFSVELDEDLRIARRTLDGTTLDFDQLSSGAREQLSVLARVACAAIVGVDGGVPLILDDALGYSDPQRLERLGAALRVGARECQVIVLTCVPDRYRAVADATVVRLP